MPVSFVKLIVISAPCGTLITGPGIEPLYASIRVIVQFYLVSIAHHVVLVLGIRLAVHRHRHVRAERTYILPPNLEELSEFDIAVAHYVSEFKMNDPLISVFGVRMRRLMDRTNADICRNFLLFPLHVDGKLRMGVKTITGDDVRIAIL